MNLVFPLPFYTQCCRLKNTDLSDTDCYSILYTKTAILSGFFVFSCDVAITRNYSAHLFDDV